MPAGVVPGVTPPLVMLGAGAGRAGAGLGHLPRQGGAAAARLPPARPPASIAYRDG